MVPVWSDEYCTSIPEIDGQHKSLFSMLAQLDEAFSSGDTLNMSTQVLEGLMDYTRTHFSDEEAVFTHYGYPGAEQHIQAHQDFLEHVVEMQRKISNSSLLVSMELILFLGEWLRQHVMQADQDYAKYIRQAEGRLEARSGC